MVNAKRKDTAQEKDGTVQEVVRRMQTEYAKTGLYNSADLQRVLGNPKNSVGFTSPDYSSPGNIKQKTSAK